MHLLESFSQLHSIPWEAWTTMHSPLPPWIRGYFHLWPLPLCGNGPLGAHIYVWKSSCSSKARMPRSGTAGQRLCTHHIWQTAFPKYWINYPQIAGQEPLCLNANLNPGFSLQSCFSAPLLVGWEVASPDEGGVYFLAHAEVHPSTPPRASPSSRPT